MSIRKQRNEISIADLVEYPVWEFVLDEEETDSQDENTLRPYLTWPLYIEGIYLIVRAKFILSNGITMVGYVKPEPLSVNRLMEPLLPYDFNPVILTEYGLVNFCYGLNKPDEATISENYRRLGYQSEYVFPIHFAADIEIADGFAQGVLEGFLYFEDEVANFFKLNDSDIKITK